jgi:GR25 family glycosyltransferase involved in LPS biosynthesis
MVLSAALSDIQFEFVDGVIGKDVLDKAIPTKPGHKRMLDSVIGCWGAHMDAIEEFVSVTSLILWAYSELIQFVG